MGFYENIHQPSKSPDPTLVTRGLLTKDSSKDELYYYLASIENIINWFKININKL